MAGNGVHILWCHFIAEIFLPLFTVNNVNNISIDSADLIEVCLICHILNAWDNKD
jgi:hypothetical protein